MSIPIKLIVGLGNPGSQYTDNRHNVGKWFVQELADRQGIALKTAPKFKGLVCQINIDNHNCWLLAPLTYMNCSGEAVKVLASFYKIPVESILVVYDELDFSPGVIRLKQDGGHGGHNGLRNITDHLHSNNFYRLRIGIGHPGNKNVVADYVLNRPSRDEQLDIITAIDRGISVLPNIVSGDIEKAMNVLHGE